MPTVKPRESRSDFVSRCIPVVLREGATQAHAIAKCGGIFDTHKRRVTTNRTRIVPNNPLKADPTRSATLRRIFTTDISVRFSRLKRKLWRLIVEQDAFGLTGTQNKEQDNVRHGIVDGNKRIGEGDKSIETGRGPSLPTIPRHQNSLGGEARGVVTSNAGRWAFQTDKRKVKLFEKWLKTQVQIDILADIEEEDKEEASTKVKSLKAYWKKYVQQGYEKGAGRAFDDVRKPALTSGQEQLAFFAGTKEEFLRQSFARPVAIQKVKRLAERVFTGLKDVTDDMDNILRRQLTEGLTQGMNPKDIARKMIKEGIGNKTRGVQSRAERIARTEIIRAHAEGQLDALEDLGVTEVGVMVEWSTAGDDRVCPLCSALDGVVLTIKEARGILPRHVNCRCAHIPANVGESRKGQQRGKTEVKGAFDDSIRAERKKGSLAEKKDKSKWLGTDKTIVKKRPRSVLGEPRFEPTRPTIPPEKLRPKIVRGRTSISTKGVPKARAEKARKEVDRQLDGMDSFKLLKEVREKDQVRAVFIRDPSDLAVELKLRADKAEKLAGVYIHNRDRILLAGDRTIVAKTKLKMGKWTIADDLGSDFRHEYGHRIFERTLGKKSQTEWQSVARKYTRKPLGEKAVGKYAATNEHELFAESFSAYTSKSYTRGLLPKDIELFLDKRIRDGIK